MSRHRIVNVEAALGELTFDAEIGRESRRVWFRSDSEVVPNADAALATCLMPAMRVGGALALDAPVSPRILRNQREFQAIQRAWSLDWDFGDPPLLEVQVEAPAREPQVREPVGRVAAFFSGGVDSWSTVLDEPALTDVIFVRGLDILPNAPHQAGLADGVEDRLRAAAGELGVRLHAVETNLRELSEPLARWEAYYGCAVSAVALLLAPLFDRVLITGDSDYAAQMKLGANWLVDQLWSTENLEIVDAGGRHGRMRRVEMIAGHPAVHKSLRVCWRNPDGAYNCGKCRKCLMTMASLDAIGALQQVETFPSEVDLEALGSIEILQPVSLPAWEDMLEAARRHQNQRLERVLAKVVAGGRGALGLPAGHRSRRQDGPAAATDDTEPSKHSLWATPETARALAEASGAAFLVGSYDGSGNYGDMAQLDGALSMLAAFDGSLLILPVLERRFRLAHAELEEELVHRPDHVLFLRDADESPDDRLVRIPPPQLPSAVLHLYGGGFLNPSWGERKLAMLRAVEQLLEGTQAIARIGSGQQADLEWLEGLAVADLELLAAFEVLGARDHRSAEALAGVVESSRAPNTGDDAVALIATLAGAGEARAKQELAINVHVAEHAWMTGQGGRVPRFFLELIEELGRIGGRAPQVRPLIAYQDPRIDERSAVERFTAACAECGISVSEPLLLRPASLRGAAAELREAHLTVSSSYHVALTSLLLGVPAVALRDNAYYDQKARGLLADFGLGEEFAPSSGDDATARAAELGPHLFDEQRSSALRQTIRDAGVQLRLRRQETEALLLAHVAEAAVLASDPARASSGADARPVQQRAEEAERRLAEAEAAAAAAREAEAEARRGEAEARAVLEALTSSRSWRLMEPLRRLASRVRGR